MSLDLEKFAGHTPGPWEVHDDWYIGAYGHEGGGHAEVKSCPGVGPDKKDEHRANARLIAAAPQLLAELRAARAENERLRGAIKPFADEYATFIKDFKQNVLGACRANNPKIRTAELPFSAWEAAYRAGGSDAR